MLANLHSLSLNPMFLRHDLMIELGRLELAISDMRGASSANESDDLVELESRRSAISSALVRLSA
jgi:hypothetical protein